MKEATYGCLGSLGSRGSLPGGSEQPPGGKNLRAPLFPFVPLHFRGVTELCLGLRHTCKITDVCSQLRCPEPFASQRRRRREQQEPRSPPRPPFGEQLPPQGPCLRRDERMLPKRLLETTTMEPMGRCLLQGPLSVQQMRERAYREDWRAAGTLWRLQECNRVGGDLSFRL